MSSKGTGSYARGINAVAICERCSKKSYRRELVYDGQYPDLLVCADCWDPKHPQEYLPPVTDPITIYDPTGDPDRIPASTLHFNGPWNLRVVVAINSGRYNIISGSGILDA